MGYKQIIRRDEFGLVWGEVYNYILLKAVKYEAEVLNDQEIEKFNGWTRT